MISFGGTSLPLSMFSMALAGLLLASSVILLNDELDLIDLESSLA